MLEMQKCFHHHKKVLRPDLHQTHFLQRTGDIDSLLSGPTWPCLPSKRSSFFLGPFSSPPLLTLSPFQLLLCYWVFFRGSPVYFCIQSLRSLYFHCRLELPDGGEIGNDSLTMDWTQSGVDQRWSKFSHYPENSCSCVASMIWKWCLSPLVVLCPETGQGGGPKAALPPPALVGLLQSLPLRLFTVEKKNSLEPLLATQ